MHEQLTDILSQYKGDRGALIPILQKVQEKFSFIPKETLPEIADFLRITENDIFGVASFYAQFRFNRPGRHILKVCLGTACHVRGGETILDGVERELGVKSGSTTSDDKFSLERVACFGSCALAPVMVIDNDVYGRVTTSKAKQILSGYK